MPKKPYAPPKITKYGTLTEITRAVANTGMLDGSPAVFMLKTGATV